MVNMYNHTHIQHRHNMNNSSAKEYVYRKFDEMKQAIRWDTFNLTRGQQDTIESRLVEVKKALDEVYGTNG